MKVGYEERQEQGNEVKRILRNEVVEIEGTIDRLEDISFVIDKRGSLSILTRVQCKDLRFKKPLQAIGDTAHLYRNFNFYGFLDSSVEGKNFSLREFYNQFDDEKSKVLYMQRLTILDEKACFLRDYEFIDAGKRDYDIRLAERIAREKMREEGR